MTFAIFTLWTAVTMGLDILLTLLILAAALGLGLILRRILVRRLKKTVLDNWFIQTLGVVVVLLPLTVAGAGVPLVWDPTLIRFYWDNIKNQWHLPSASELITHTIYTLLLIGLGVGGARTIRKLIVGGLGESRVDINIRTLIGRIFYYIILIFAVFWILSIWSVSLTVPVTVVSVLTIAIAVSIQDILKDLVAGVYILIERPFHIGDEISTTNLITYTGKVEDIQLRATKLRLVSGEEMTIPNSLVFGNIVVNNTFYGERRATISVTMQQEDFHRETTPEQIISALREVERVEPKPEPTVMLSKYTGTQITLTIRFWIGTKELSTVTNVMYTLHKILPNAELTVQESGGDV